MAIALVVLACAGCPAKKTSNTVKTGSGTGLSNLIKKTVLSWGFSREGDNSDVFLATTDETGAQTSHPVGRYPGTCERLTAEAVKKEMNALLAAKCTGPAGAVELHAVKQNSEIIIMKMAGGATDPMAREEVTRVAVDLSAAVEVAP